MTWAEKCMARAEKWMAFITAIEAEDKAAISLKIAAQRIKKAGIAWAEEAIEKTVK